MPTRIHASDFGTEACLRKARDAVFWTNISAELHDFISNYTCNKMQDQQLKQLLFTLNVRKNEQNKVLISSFTTCKTQDNLVTVDYFCYLFVLPVDIVTDTSAMAENECIRQQYAPHVIPDVVISDNSN